MIFLVQQYRKLASLVHPPARPSLAGRSPLKKPCFFSLRDRSSPRQIKQGMMQELLTGRTRLPLNKEQ